MEVFGIILDWFGGVIFSLPLTVAFLLLADRCRFIKKWIWVILFVLYMHAMLNIVGVPNISYIRWYPVINWIPFTDLSGRNIIGMVLNIALFIPFGGFVTLYFKEFQGLKNILITGFLMSLSIEILQLATYRATDVDDLIMNTLGVVIGYGIAKVVFKKFIVQESSRDKVKLAVMILLTLLVIFFAR